MNFKIKSPNNPILKALFSLIVLVIVFFSFIFAVFIGLFGLVVNTAFQLLGFKKPFVFVKKADKGSYSFNLNRNK